VEHEIMILLPTRLRIRPQVRHRRPRRLAIEALEERYALSNGLGLDSTGISVQDVWAAMDSQNYPPVISNFTASETGTTWIFAGNVTDPDEPVGGFIVTFGGLPSVNGKTTTVQANGAFSLGVQLGANENGGVSAQTVDAGGLKSNLAMVYVHQTP
jgi:hypothetical protein